MSRPTLCLDFDGVIHSYTSGWIEADFIPDPPVPGAFEFIHEAMQHYEVVIFSSRSGQENGIRAMKNWMIYWARRELANDEPDYKANSVINRICINTYAWPTKKPSAFLTIDDRAITFDGTWPDIKSLKDFKPWNKR